MSRLIKCVNRHFYDAERWARCPICDKTSNDSKMKKKTSADHIDNFQAVVLDDAPTTFFGLHKEVCGWLVCVSGNSRGLDYRITEGKNSLGRATSNDIVIDDPGLEDKSHCVVVYDSRKNDFWLVPSERFDIRINGNVLQQQTKIYHGDRIEVADTSFIFITFCDETRNWMTIE